MTARQRIRLGMIGGGQGAFIGAVHRMAARLDGRFELVAGMFSSRPEINRASALELGVDTGRCYDDLSVFIDGESVRPDGVEAVAIVTPNHLHFESALACVEAGLHVICEKPMTVTADEARLLADAVERRGVQFLLAHTYSGYPLVHQARELVCSGELGKVRSVQVEYVQEWLTQPPEADNKQAEWRLDPDRAGAAGCLGDIGTHAYQLACFVSGLRLDSVSADVSAMVPGRLLDDNVHALLRFQGGAKGMLWASQTSPGFENGLRIRVVGEKASLEWFQESPNELWFAPLNQPRQRLTRRDDWANGTIAHGMRVPGGHPEGYLEAFANLYQGLADRVQDLSVATEWMPDAHTGVAGLHFISAVLESSRADGAWVRLPHQSREDAA